ncbi:MAG TPA: TrmH family RNA methyltransferase [Chloroflexia bacterium]|nr:TrmH family RNA methyltransferase [Chloroflexia bacterium]
MNVELKKYRKEYEHSYSFGVFPTLELLHFQPESVIRVIAASRGVRNEGVLKLAGECHKRNIAYEVNDKVLERLVPKENIYAVGIFRKYSCPLNEQASHVLLVNPSDMGNLGTIIRTMLGFGVGNLGIVRPATDLFDPKVIRASMGALFKLSFEYFDSFTNYQSRFPHQLYPFMTDGKAALDKTSFTAPFTLIFGNESAGLPEEYRSLGTSVSIQHSQQIDSLNLPIAVGVALYEATKGNF